jgi:hypothetical protein
VPILSADKPFFTGLVPGTYEVIGYGSNGCTNRSDVFTYTSIETPESLGLRATLFPNPASQSATLSLHSDQQLSLNISMFDVNGRMVLEPVHTSIFGSYTHHLPVSGLSAGI